MLIVFRPSFEVVTEGRILHFVSGDRRLTLISMEYDIESPVVDKSIEISNLELIRDIDRIIKLEEVSSLRKYSNS